MYINVQLTYTLPGNTICGIMICICVLVRRTFNFRKGIRVCQSYNDIDIHQQIHFKYFNVLVVTVTKVLRNRQIVFNLTFNVSSTKL